MKKAFHTLMLTVATVGLTAGAALAADDAMNSPATGAAQMQNQAQTDASGDTAATSAAAGQTTQANADDASSAGQVQSVQAKLKAEGYPVSVDGVWGPQSAEALRQFQQANNLDASGQIDAQTLTAMNIDASASSGTAMGESRNW